MRITSSKSAMRRRNARIRAAEEGDVIDDDIDVADTSSVDGVLFEANDVADLLSEVTGEDVEVVADDESEEITFTVGDEEYTVEPEPNTEVLEMTRVRGRQVSASSRYNRRRRPISASRNSYGRSRVVRRIPRY